MSFAIVASAVQLNQPQSENGHSFAGAAIYANLTPDTYTVAASANGKTQTKRVEVQANSARSLNFAW